MRLHTDLYLSGLDALVANYGGKTLRIYTGNVQPSFGTAPAGTLLAELTIPNPSHSASAYNATAGQFEALLSGAWQDVSANASGTIGCFAVFDGSTVLTDGDAGTGDKDLVTSAASVSAGAPFSIQKFTFRQPAITP